MPLTEELVVSPHLITDAYLATGISWVVHAGTLTATEWYLCCRSGSCLWYPNQNSTPLGLQLSATLRDCCLTGAVLRQVRIELTALGLWDLRAANCATAALYMWSKFDGHLQGALYVPIFPAPLGKELP